jgi:hypothetical protein
MRTDDNLILTTMAFCAFLLFAAIFYGFYDKDKQNNDLIRFRTQHAAILEDVINDIYENDREYFDKNIATSAPFDSLRSLYKDEFKRDPKQITWDDIYNY